MLAGIPLVIILVLVCGIVGDVFAIVNRACANQSFWMLNAFWIYILALLIH